MIRLVPCRMSMADIIKNVDEVRGACPQLREFARPTLARPRPISDRDRPADLRLRFTSPPRTQ